MPLLVEARRAAARRGGRRRGPRAPALGLVAELIAVEVELTVGGRVARRGGERGVALDQVAEVVAGLGRVEQVGRDRGVERQPVDARSPLLQQRAHQRLGVVAARRPRRLQRRDRPSGSARWAAGIQVTAAAAASVTTARPASGERAPAPRPTPPRRRAVPRPPSAATASATESLTVTSATSVLGAPAGRAHDGAPGRALRPAARRTCGTRGSRTAALHLGRRRGCDRERRRGSSTGASRRSTITSGFLRDLRASCSASDRPQLGRLLVEVVEDAVEAAVGR